MARGITIKITRKVERRERRKDEIGVYIWAGTCSRALSSLPRSPSLASIYGDEPEVITTTIEFLPPGVVPHAALEYQKHWVPKMRALGVIK